MCRGKCRSGGTSRIFSYGPKAYAFGIVIVVAAVGPASDAVVLSLLVARVTEWSSYDETGMEEQIL